jgi:hypothetical protein
LGESAAIHIDLSPEGLYSLCDDGLVARLTSAVAILVGVGFGATVGCRKAPEAKPAIDAGLAACIPPDATLIGGVDLAALRASPLYSKMPPAANAFAAQLGGVSSVLAAYNGKDLLIALRGNFKAPPEGAATLAPGLALIGSPEQMAAATAQYKSGRAGAPALLAKAESVAAGSQVWIAARGDIRLPLTGNAANLTGILRKAQFVTLTARTAAGLAFELRAFAPDANAASAIEETLRADLTLAAAGEAKRADVAMALRSAQVTRADREVHVALTASDDVAGRLLAMF